MPIAQKHFITALYDSFPDPVVIFDAAKTIIAANDAAVRQFGHPRDGFGLDVLRASAGDVVNADRNLHCFG